MEAKHTKGEWFACKITNTTNYSVRTNERPELIIVPVNLTEVNETIHNDLIGEAIANAKLIAAAPEMLEVLQEIIQLWNDPKNPSGIWDHVIHAKAIGVIKKTTE